MSKSFEEAILELEKIVRNLENKDIKLDEAVESYRKGMELSKECYEMLNNAEKLIVKTVDDKKTSEVE